MLKALSFDSDDNVETVQENNTSTQGTNKVSIEMQPHFLPPSGYLKVEKISSSPISVGYQYGEHIFNQRNDYRPNFPSQFAPLNSNKFQRSATEIISPGLRTGNKNKTFISERDVSFVTDEPLSRFEHDFEVLETLGTGVFHVFKCLNILDKQTYVVKWTQNKVKDEESFNKILNLIQINPSCSDEEPNNYHVRYYNSWKEEDGNLFVVMEYCLGNLSDLNRDKSEEGIKNIMRDICSALKPLHTQNKGHCHIKPENILLSKSGKWKLGDNGLANLGYQIKLSGEEAAIDDIIHDSMYYFSPELEECEGQDLDFSKCDMFSLGLVIAEHMMGIKLREHQNTRDSLLKGDFKELDSLNYSSELIGVVKQLLSQEPSQRPSAEGLLTTFLQKGIQKDLKEEKKNNEVLKANVDELKTKLGIKKRKNSF